MAQIDEILDHFGTLDSFLTKFIAETAKPL
jgi:hypothetical protein